MRRRELFARLGVIAAAVTLAPKAETVEAAPIVAQGTLRDRVNVALKDAPPIEPGLYYLGEGTDFPVHVGPAFTAAWREMDAGAVWRVVNHPYTESTGIIDSA